MDGACRRAVHIAIPEWIDRVSMVINRLSSQVRTHKYAAFVVRFDVASSQQISKVQGRGALMETIELKRNPDVHQSDLERRFTGRPHRGTVIHKQSHRQAPCHNTHDHGVIDPPIEPLNLSRLL